MKRLRTADKVTALEKRIKKIETKMFEIECGIKKTKSHGSKEKGRPSIKEFIDSKSYRNDIQLTLIVAYYLEKVDGITPFGSLDIRQGCMKAGIRVPPNINCKIYVNVEYGFLLHSHKKTGNRKSWVLTDKGVKYIEDCLDSCFRYR